MITLPVNIPIFGVSKKSAGSMKDIWEYLLKSMDYHQSLKSLLEFWLENPDLLEFWLMW